MTATAITIAPIHGQIRGKAVLAFLHHCAVVVSCDFGGMLIESVLEALETCMNLDSTKGALFQCFYVFNLVFLGLDFDIPLSNWQFQLSLVVTL